jgi:hypothetical protein
MKGVFTYSKGSIPFEMFTVDGVTTIQIDGAKKPIVLAKSKNSGSLDLTGALPLPDSVKKEIDKKSSEIMNQIGRFLLTKADNPEHIASEPATATIGGREVQLNKIHMDMNGDEWRTWLKGLIYNVLADNSGLKELVGQLYELIAPQLAASAGSEDGASSGSALTGIFANKDLAVGLLTTVFQGMLTRTALGLDGESATATSGDGTDQASDNTANAAKKNDAGILAEISSFALDLGIDADANVRETNLHLELTSPDSSKDGIGKIDAILTSQRWNIDQPVQADTVVSNDNYSYTSETTRARDLMSFFIEGTPIYKMLKDDLHKNRDVIKMPVGDAGDMSDGVHPYISNGSTLIPARFVVEKLDADIQWNGETQQVTIIDPFSHRKIVLAIGSKQATVDGKATTLETAAELTDSSTFVPVRFIAEALGCKVEWNDKTRTVIITREAD